MDIIDRIAESSDFNQFIGDIKDDADIRKIKSQYDSIFYDDKAMEYARNKYII